MKRNITFFTILIIGVFLVFNPTFAALPFGPFGGRVIAEVACLNGILLAIGPPTPGLYLLPPTAAIFSWYAPIIPNWVLGTSFPGGTCHCPSDGCVIKVAKAAVLTVVGFVIAGPVGAFIGGAVGTLSGDVPANATIIMIGTSLR